MKIPLALCAIFCTSCASLMPPRTVVVETQSKELIEKDRDGNQIRNTIVIGEIKY